MHYKFLKILFLLIIWQYSYGGKVDVQINKNPDIHKTAKADLKNSKTDALADYFANTGSGRSYEALIGHPSLRIDVELLKKLGKYLNDKGEDEMQKVQDFLTLAKDDKKRRLSIEYISKNGLKFIQNITESTIAHLKRRS